ncbi:MAG: hypothetical protein IPL71_11270 [Anaerolineales bacterium]|nr:hypothetical protein [Anaerolineales bacterium]
MLFPSPSCGRVTPFCEVLLMGAAMQVASLAVSMAGEPLLRGRYAGEPVSMPRFGSEPMTLLEPPLVSPQASAPVDLSRL